jgi:hypothetical protein
MATKNLPAKAQKQDVVSWNDMLKTTAAKQVKAAEALNAGSVMVSFKGATLTIAGAQRRNNQARTIILATMNERAFYEGKYNPDEPRTPICYAYGEIDMGMPIGPHEEASLPQNKTCKGCEHAEWGTADVGRGQACRQSVKLALVALPDKGGSPEEIGNAPVNFARLPPTSLASAKVYLDWLGVQELPTFAVETLLEVRPSSKSIFTVHLTPGDEVPATWRGSIMNRVAEAMRTMAQPYPKFEEEKKPAPKTGKKRF